MNFFKSIFKWCFILLIWIGIVATIALFYYLHDLPSLADLEAESGKQIVEINYSNLNRLTNRGEIYTSKVNYYQLPQNLINAVVAIEDRRFFNHHGVDVFGILRAFYVNREAGHIVQGGSTITQQLAKLLFLDSEKTFKRKIQEMLLAVQLERHFTKEQIITFYLNRAYFGAGAYGIENAARQYFSKNVSNLNLRQCAILAGVLKAPSKLSPKNNPELANERAWLVLKSMVEMGFLSKKNFAQMNTSLDYKSDRSQRFYFSDYVYDQFREFLNKRDAQEKTLTINTTLDEDIQEKVEEKIDKFIARQAKKLGKSEIAAVIMTRDGAIVGMAGGTDYHKSQFNRAIYAKRQSGSAFKTFVYLAAFENGFKIDDLFEDRKINIGTWLPDNYEGKYLGKVTLENAFANSLNSVAAQLAQKVGTTKIAKEAHECGIISKIDKDDPTISLGTTEVSLLELVSAYGTIANNGEPVIPYAINEIRNFQDEVLYNHQSSGFETIISAKALQEIRQAMRKVITSGTGKNANVAENIYGKTGTSQDYRDAWFIGFNDDYVIGIWIGNDDNSPTNKITGGSLPALLFGEIIGDL